MNISFSDIGHVRERAAAIRAGRRLVHSAAVGGRVSDVEQWFVRRGVPHFIDDYAATTDIWTRSVPLLAVAYLAGGLTALDLDTWSWRQNLVVGLAVVAALVIGWSIINLIRRRPWAAMPDVVGTPELAVFVIGPSLPALVLGQWRDALGSIVTGLGVLVVIYLLTSYAVPALLRWAAGRAIAQFSTLASLVARALPLLLLFTTFLFINAEVWQVAGTLDGLPYVATIGVFFLLGAVFVLSRMPALFEGLNSFTHWSEVRPLVVDTPAARLVPADAMPLPEHHLSVRQRVNLALVAVFSQALQITLVAALLAGFFVLFGFLAIPESTTASWTGLDPVAVIVEVGVGERTLVVTESLLRVAVFLGAFSGMYFTVLLATDATYRDEFADDVSPQLRSALAVRLTYLAHRQHPDTPDSLGAQ